MQAIDVIMVALVLTCLLMLGSSRLGAYIRIVAVQGMVAAVLPLLVQGHGLSVQALLVSGVTLVMKGIVFPRLLFRALYAAGVRREIEVYVSFPMSVLAGVLMLAGSFWLSGRLPLGGQASGLAVPVAMFTVLTGLFLIVSRVLALTQVVGYLTLENGIYLLSVLLVPQQLCVIELGILLDAFVAVFVMGIAIFHISRAFDHIDTQAMDALADWRGEQEGAR